MAINLGSSPIAEIKLGSTPAEKVFLGTTLVWPFLTTLSGIPPIVMLNALERYVYSLTQAGKCEQSGTPTPSAPVDIYCNNGVLKVGRETYTTPLGRTVYGGTLDVVTGELVVDRAMITLNGSESWTKSSNGNVYYLTLNASTFPYGQSVEQYNVCDQYAFKGFASGSYASFLSDGEYLLYRWSGSGGGSSPREIAFKNNSITSVTDWKTLLQSNPVQVVYELETPQTYQLTPQTVEMIAERSTFQSNASGNIDITYYANGILKTVSGNPVVITDADGQDAEDVTVHIEPIQSGSGTPSPTNTRPISGMTDINITRLGGVVADGTPEALTVTGKNKINGSYSEITQTVRCTAEASGNGFKITSTASSGATYATVPIPNITSLLGQTVTLSYSSSGSGVRIGFFYLNSSEAATGSISYTETTTLPASLGDNAGIGIVFYTSNNNSATYNDIQLELGSTATAYEPYSAQTVANIPMLLSVGDYKDEGELISGLLTHKCGVKVLTSADVATFSNGCFFVNIDDKMGGKGTILSTHFTYVAGASSTIAVGEMGASGGTSKSTFYKVDGVTSKAEAGAWVDGQYAAGTPVIIVYPLATETTEQTTDQQIMAHAGSNTIDISPKNVSGINLEVKYWAS